MIDDFDHILKQLLANLPQHSPKSEVWSKISTHLDEDIAMTRLRRVLKNNEHKPKTDLWPAIESSLNRPVFWKTFYHSAWVKFVIPSFIILTTLFFVSPYFNTEQKLIYKGPLQRNVNTKEINSENTDVRSNKQSESFANPDLTSANNAAENFTVTVENLNIPDYVDNTSSQIDENVTNVQVSENVMNNENNALTFQSDKTENVQPDNYNIGLVTPLSLLMIENIWASDYPLISRLNSNYSENISSDKGLGKGSFSLELSYAPEVSFMHLKKNSGDYDIDLQKRKQAELISYSNTAGFEGKVDFRHWFFQTGLSYSTISTLSEYRYKYSGVDTLGWHLDTMFVYIWIDTLGYFHDSLSYAWSAVTDTVSYENIMTPSYQLKYLQIPLIAGYSVSKGKFQYSVSGGVSLGIPLSVSGHMLEPDDYTISNVANQSLSLQKIVYNGVLRMGVNYFISPRYSVFAQPSIRYTLNSVFDKKYPVNQKYFTCGLRFGIAYRF